MRYGRICLFLLLLAAAVACSAEKSPAAQPAAVSSAPGGPGTPIGIASVARPAVQVPVEPLRPVWVAWDILKDGYVEKSKLNAEAMSQASVKALLDQLGEGAPAIGDSPQPATKPPREMPKELQPLWNGWAALHESYSGQKPLDEVKLGQRAASAFLAWLEDPHTEYIPPDQFRTFAQDFYGNYGGIGAEVIKNANNKVILNPMPDSPAEKAGLKAGDALVAVDGQSVEGWSLLQVVNRVRGPRGSEVALTLLHFGAEQQVTLRVVRDVISLKSVFWNMTNDNFAYLRISFFYDNTPQAILQTLQEIQARGASGIVLDLRNNPGGFLRATVDVAEQFINSSLVLYEIDGAGKRTEWNADRGGIATKIPMVILVNQFTASGSEVFAGALQDYGRAKVVGVTTFGKGSVNLFRELPDGGGLYYTHARWYTPSGRLIEGKGLEPDVLVVAGSGGRGGDPQLDRGLELLRQEVSATLPAR